MKALILLTMLAVAGVVHASDAKISTDQFDGATRVEIDPHGLNCGMQMVCPLLGARWLSTYPDEAVLKVQVINAYASIESVKLNIDGEFIDLKPLSTTAPTKFDSNVEIAGGAPVARYSSKDYTVPMELLKRLMAAASVKVRVVTNDGLVDGTLSGGKKPTKAYGALQRFVAKVPGNA